MAHANSVEFNGVRLYVDWTMASTRENIFTGTKDSTTHEHGEALATSLGKIAKWYTSFDDIVWNGHPTYTRSDTTTTPAQLAHAGTFTSITSVTSTNGHVTSVNTATYKLPAQYTHPTYTRSNTTSEDSPEHGETFTAIDSITTNSLGHVTAVNTKTVKLPTDQNTDTKVTQTNTTGDANYRVLLSANANDTTETTTSRKTNKLTLNTSTGMLTVGYRADNATYPVGGLAVHDIRNCAVTPANGDKMVNFYFTHNDSSVSSTAIPYSSGWATIIHVRGYSGAYNSWELAGPSNNTDQRTTPLYVRTSNAGSTWGDWRKIYDSSNPPTYTEVGAASSSHTHNYAGSSSAGGSATSADKLKTARTIELGNDFTGSASFDGSSDITISAGFYRINANGNNKANYPWHRFGYIENKSASNTDTDAVFLIVSKYVGGHFGILKASFRTNSATATPPAACSGNVRWLVRSGFAEDAACIAWWGVSGEAVYADLFLKCGTWPRITIYQMSGNRGWNLIYSNEVTDTTATDKKTSVEVYSTIATAATEIHNKAYTTISYSVQYGNVSTSKKLIDGTGTALSVGSTTQPIYFSDGVPTATTYALNATVNSGTANRLAYYSDANTISKAQGTSPAGGLAFNTKTNTASTPATGTLLHIWGSTYGNTAGTMISGTAGLFSYGDGGPQINFSTNETPGGGQDGALIYTDHDTAATGVSWHFVSNQSDWNVTSKRFHARTSISIGTDKPSTSYNLSVTGTSAFSSADFGTALNVIRNSSTSTNFSAIKYSRQTTVLGYIGFREADGSAYRIDGSNTSNQYVICDASNTTFTRSLTSGTKIGTLKIAGGTAVDLYCQTNTNTDTLVTQSSSTTANYRPIILGYTNTTTVSDLAATVTNQTYVTTKIYAQPSSGTIYATAFNENGTSLANKYIPLTGSNAISGSLETNSTSAGFIVPGSNGRKMSLIGGNLWFTIGTTDWASGMVYQYSGTTVAQIGAHGTGSSSSGTCDYFFMGKAYNDAAMRVENDNTGKMTLRGTLPQLKFQQTTTDKTYNNNNAGIKAYPADTNGMNMTIQSNGNMIIGSGDYPTNWYNLSGKTSDAPDYWSATGEQTYVGSDNYVIIHTNADTIANRKTHIFSSHLTLDVGGDLVFRTDYDGQSYPTAYPTGGIRVSDLRNVTVTPTSGNKNVNFYFTHGVANAPTSNWWSIIHMRGYTGNYNTWEVAGPSHSTDQRTTPLYVRTSGIVDSTATWGSWRKIYDTSNPPTYTEVGAASSSHTHDSLVSVPLTGAQLPVTAGNFFFKSSGTSVIGTSTADWVGIQADSGADRFQIVGSSNHLMYRQNDNTTVTASNWNNWVGLMSPSCVTSDTGITVTPTTTTLGTGEGALTYNSGIKISHSHSVPAVTTVGMLKVAYNAQGHILESSPFASADVSALLNLLSTGTTTPVDADYYISQYVNGGTSDTTYRRRPVSALWTYMKGKADSVYAPLSHTHAAGDVTSGTFGVARGGTGRSTLTANAILAGNTTSAINMIATASGALYATAANGAASFGTLPIAQGGTGKTTALEALTNLGGPSIGSVGMSIGATSSATKDLNNYTTPGTYYSAQSSESSYISNGPTTGSGYKLFVAKGYGSNNRIWQIASGNSVGNIWFRFCENVSASTPSWSDWKRICYSDHTHSNYLGASKASTSYYGMTDPDGTDTHWIRTTTQGIIPYQSGNAGSGHQQLGTSTWYFSAAYIDTVHGSLSGNASTATTATTATNVTVTLNNPTSSTMFCIPFFNSETPSTGSKSLLTNDGIRGYSLEGVANTVGYGYLVLGNSTKKSVAKNKVGILRLYSDGDKYINLRTMDGETAITENRTIKLPNASGTIALTSNIPATYAGSTTAGGAATTVTITNTENTSEVSKAIPFHDNSAGGPYGLLTNDGLGYRTLNGTASAPGISRIVIGNATASGTAGNKYGVVRIYSRQTYYADIQTATTYGANRTFTLPNASGTIALTSNIPGAGSWTAISYSNMTCAGQLSAGTLRYRNFRTGLVEICGYIKPSTSQATYVLSTVADIKPSTVPRYSSIYDGTNMALKTGAFIYIDTDGKITIQCTSNSVFGTSSNYYFNFTYLTG